MTHSLVSTFKCISMQWAIQQIEINLYIFLLIYPQKSMQWAIKLIEIKLYIFLLIFPPETDRTTDAVMAAMIRSTAMSSMKKVDLEAVL